MVEQEVHGRADNSYVGKQRLSPIGCTLSGHLAPPFPVEFLTQADCALPLLARCGNVCTKEEDENLNIIYKFI